MDDYGWIQLHRKLLNNCIFSDANLLQLFIYCLLRANHKANDLLFNGEVVKLKRGQFLTGRKVIAKDLKQKESTIYKRLKILEKLQYLNIESNNRFSILTIVNYNTYQSDNSNSNSKSNNSVTTKEQQSNTNNNDNNEDNEKKELLTIDTLEILFQSVFGDFPQDIKLGEDVCRGYFLADIKTKQDFELLENSYKAMRKTTSTDYIPKSFNFFRDWRKYIPETKQKKEGVRYIEQS